MHAEKMLSNTSLETLVSNYKTISGKPEKDFTPNDRLMQQAIMGELKDREKDSKTKKAATKAITELGEFDRQQLALRKHQPRPEASASGLSMFNTGTKVKTGDKEPGVSPEAALTSSKKNLGGG